MKIVIATGIYPPATSGPAQYAAAMKAEFEARGHQVHVATFGIEHSLPTGIRHLFYFLKVWRKICDADFVLALDTFSAGLPATCAARMCGTPILLRTGGDFLYEQFIERTNESILLTEFYQSSRAFTKKEILIFWLIRWTLQHVNALIFSTEWQRDIFLRPYQLQRQKIFIVQNRFDEKIADEPAMKKNFIFPTRKLAYKNIDPFRDAFARAQKKHPDISLEVIHHMPHAELIEKMKTCYAVVMPSRGEISPHVILDALRVNKPFLLTTESGYATLLGQTGVLIDPRSIESMQQGIEALADTETYERVHARVRAFGFTHTWSEIADELLTIFRTTVV